MAASITVQLQIYKRPQLPRFSTDLDEIGIKMLGLLVAHPFLTGGCTGSSEYTLVKMPHCWKSHAAAH